MYNYDGKRFRPIQNTENGETSADTIFLYTQQGNIVQSSYAGGAIVTGHLVGIVAADGSIDMRYHQVNVRGELMTGRCKSVPELLPSGKLRLHEEWQWTSGDGSAGRSVIEEV